MKVSTTAKENKLIQAMQLLGDHTRFKIFKLLLAKDDLCVSEIADQLDISVSAVSQHFRNFELIGIVEKRRVGQRICYQLKSDEHFTATLVKLTKE